MSSRGDAPSGNGDGSSPDLRCRSPGLSVGSSLGHVPHSVSPGLRPMTPVASPSQLYYPAGTLAPGPVLTPLFTGTNNDTYLHRHGMDRGILTNDPNVQVDPHLQDQVGGHNQASTSTHHLHRYLLRPPTIKLWRRLRGCHGRHDTPVVELPRLRWEP
jgi:hypothetical protein